jgi:hypothetical protein
MYFTFSAVLIPLLSVYGISSLWKLFFNKFERYKDYVFFAFLLIMIIVSVLFIKQVFDSKWFMVGKQPLDPVNSEVSTWIKQNTNINDVLLTTNENSFAIGALTGRKGVTNRRSHSGMYVDMDKRFVSSALILYGNNDTLREDLIRSYNISYVYWDYQWMNMEFYFDEQGRIRDLFDPLLIIYSQEREKALKDANITYSIQDTWIDPGARPGPPKYKTLLVTPDNYRSYEKPWNERLDKYLTLEKEFLYQGKAAARIYKINLS